MSSNIFLWNIQQSATGTDIDSDTKALDVNIAGGAVTVTNPSVGPTGDPVPADANYIAGVNGTGDLTGILVDSAGQPQVVVTASALPTGAATEASLASLDGKTVVVDTSDVTVTASALPTGAATSALQTAGNASLTSIDTKLTAPLSVTGPLTDAELRASAVPVSLASVPLPTGAATAANQATEIASLASIDSKLTAPLAVTGPLTDAELRATAVPVSAASLPLPTGAATETTLSAVSGKLPATLGQTTMAASLAVVLASDQTAIPVTVSAPGPATGRTRVGQLFNDYTSVSVTTAAYTELTASTSATVNQIQVFDSSGQTMILAVGAAASEVDQCFIFPGGQGDISLAIPSGSRISIKARTATANSGYITINLFT